MQCGHTQPRSGEGERAARWGGEPDTADEVACVPTPSDNQIVSFSRSTG
jgi:hypothetical protein